MNESNINRRGFITIAGGISGTALFPVQTSAAEKDWIRYSHEIPVIQPYDVVVCGGGPSGTAAALSARREGLRVLLVEGQGQLGGMGTSGLVSHWLGGRTSDCTRWVVGGLFRSMAEEAEKKGVALIPVPDSTKKYQPHGWHQGQLGAGIPFDPYLMAHFLDTKIAEAGVDVLLLTQAVDVVVERNRITHVVVFNKSGLSAIPVKAVIDATGDADIAARSGCKVIKGRESDGLMTPATLQFHVDNVDQDELSDYIHEHDSPRFRKKIEELRAAGEWPFPFDIFISAQLTEKGTMFVNTSRLTGIDGTNGVSVTEGMIRGREEILQLLKVMNKHFPGFAQARLKAVAPLLGVRETRRIVGETELTVDDLVSGREFDDTIGYSAYGWDLPDPKRPSYQPMTEKKVEKRKPVTPVPYRIMVPRPLINLICPGRAVCVERDVLGPLRVMAPCFAMGEATGLAAQQVVRKNIAFRDVDVQVLRNKLRDNGAIVEWED
ncbi:MAG: FAD-dependent oxidoreductase [Candidatus Latescibacteria bacterium]|nr:FAD-dependent oxidoreductase [Candidatus Latescibacterota bacterium]